MAGYGKRRRERTGGLENVFEDTLPRAQFSQFPNRESFTKNGRANSLISQNKSIGSGPLTKIDQMSKFRTVGKETHLRLSQEIAQLKRRQQFPGDPTWLPYVEEPLAPNRYVMSRDRGPETIPDRVS